MTEMAYLMNAVLQTAVIKQRVLSYFQNYLFGNYFLDTNYEDATVNKIDKILFS